MNKTIKINISGIIFQIEEDAFEMLRDYLKSINNRLKNLPNGNETIDDIESRIAEIFQSQKGMAGTVSKENIAAMIEIIGKPEEFGGTADFEPAYTYSSPRRRLYRNPDDTIISGVCGGIGAYLNFDPVWIRLLFVIFTFFAGIGFLFYIILWIALPYAVTESQKKELFGSFYNTASARNYSATGNRSTVNTSSQGYNSGINGVGNAFNEIFRAVGKCFVIFFRIILIIIGVTFVITGFGMLIAYIMVFFFRYPGFMPTNASVNDMFYLPEFLGYFLTPTLTPWVLVLASIAILLPLLALIYWGIKMIFQFSAKDGLIGLIMFLTWLASILILSMILFSQGLSFAEEGRKLETLIIESPADTIFLKVEKNISPLQYENEISFPDSDFGLLINKSTDELFIKPEIRFRRADDQFTNIELEKSSRGRTRTEALQKAGNLIYKYRTSNDTVYVDEYFKVPAGNKWTGANVTLNFYVPEGTVICFEPESETLFKHYLYRNHYGRSENQYWIMTEDYLENTKKDD